MIAARRSAASSPVRSFARLNGESFAVHRISSTHDRPMPAIDALVAQHACRAGGRP